MDRRAIATLSAGHGAVDFAAGAIPALIPFLVVEFGLDYAAAGALMLAVTASSSLVQPLFGLWSDRRGALWLLPAGIALAAIGTGLVAVAPSYPVAVALTLVAGVGIAAYHPEGAKFAAYASDKRRASGMSRFNVGGNVGYALGPIVVTPLVLYTSRRHFRQVPANWKAFVGLGLFAALTTVSQAIAYTLTLSSYVEAVKQIEILFALAIGALVFGERQRVREISLGAGVMLAGMVLLSLAGVR